MNTLLNKYRPQARAIAELKWGRGGTNALKTNRKGAYYYSCSSHGGYIVCANDLTEAEKESLNQYTKPEYINLMVQTQHDGLEYVIRVDNTPMSRYGEVSKSYSYNPQNGSVRWVKYYIYTFEEDCEWSILEKFTNIRLKEELKLSADDLERRANSIENTFKQYYR
jgi:hypothetical protein